MRRSTAVHGGGAAAGTGAHRRANWSFKSGLAVLPCATSRRLASPVTGFARKHGAYTAADAVQHTEDLAGDVAFQTPRDLRLALAFGEPAPHIGLGGWMPAKPNDDDAMERGVGL